MRSVLIIAITLSSAQVFAQRLTDFVNPFIGTHKMGHTYPGATVPFGSVQLSPDTDTIPYSVDGKYVAETYKYCAGYQYDDPTIVGFSHTHFSGTGHSDLGDFLIMPTSGKLQLNPGTEADPKGGYRSRFSHEKESARPGYYSVMLEDDGIKAELTATTRVGIHRYSFSDNKNANIILDLMHGIYNYPGKNVWTYIRKINDSTLAGYRQTSGWARTRTVYFAMKFNKAFSSFGFKDFAPASYRGFWRRFDQSNNFPEMAGREIRAHFDFDELQDNEVMVKFALSPVSQRNALDNMEAEAPGWDFDLFKKAADDQWNQELNKVQANFMNEGDKINFYTSLYHTMLAPIIYQDVNGEYKGIDQDVHKAEGFTNYSIFSLWDTYRALHPLNSFLQPKRNADMINSMLAHQEQSPEKMLPVWSHYANENWCMSGYHSVAVIADAIVKELSGFDAEKALQACITTANTRYYDGLGAYIDKGYVPEDLRPNVSVSTTLEFAYDDWCIAQAARKLGKMDVYDTFLKRSGNWQNVYDAATGFMRPRMSDGSFRKDFDPLSTHNQGFIEGNAWNFSLFVPHDPEGMMQKMGGSRKFEKRLDELFNMHLPDHYFEETEDITREGIIGGYVHGNEPSHHVAYLYNFAGRPDKTQAMIRKIMPMQYQPKPDGLGGNDDCGQMSAWYIFSALGFYPLDVASTGYQVGSPLITEATINFENGKKLRITTRNQSEKNVYVQAVLLNGRKITGNRLDYKELVEGGNLVFEMGSKPKK